MKEVIVKEWHDDLGILRQEEMEELVRCRDCIHYRGYNEYCECDHYARDNGYCHYGKKGK